MPKAKIIGFMVWIIASMFYAYQFILRVIPNIMINDIMHKFQMDSVTFGQFSGAYYIGYSLAHIPIGILIDRYGPKIIMSTCIALTALGALPITFSDNWVYLIIGRVITGIGSAAAILCTFKVIRICFKDKLFTKMLSISVTIGLIGAIYGGAPASYMCDKLGYDYVIKIFAIVGLALAFLSYFITPDIEKSKTSAFSDVIQVFSSYKIIILAALAGLMVGPMEGFADIWGTKFLEEVYGFDKKLASSLPSMIFIGMCFGGLILSFIAEKTNSYFGTIVGSGAVMAIVFFSIIIWKLDVSIITASFLLVGICCAYQILIIYRACSYVPESVTGLTTSVVNMIIMLFGYVFHSTIGIIIRKTGGVEESSALCYGISVIPISLAVGAMGFLIFSYLDKGKINERF